MLNGLGNFCWVQLATSDVAGAKAFYGSLLKWVYQDEPCDWCNTYTIIELPGGPGGALFGINEKMRATGLVPHWGAFIAVDDVDAVVKRVGALGGRVVREPFDIREEGRMAVLQDPTGAYFQIWRAKKGEAECVKGPGAACWFELFTHDTAAAGQFYTTLFGWTMTKKAFASMGSALYTVFTHEGKEMAGMLAIEKGWGQIPSNWMIYFEVIDCDKAVNICLQKGGEILKGPTTIEGVARFAIGKDPQGAVFALFTPLPVLSMRENTHSPSR